MFRSVLWSALLVLILSLCTANAQGVLDITDFGAIPNQNDDATAQINTAAIQAAFQKASQNAEAKRTLVAGPDFWTEVRAFSDASYNQDASLPSRPRFAADDMTVLVPDTGIFYIQYTLLQGFSGVLFQINGTLTLNSNQTLWQELAPTGYYGAIHFVQCTDITVQGKQQTWTTPETMVDETDRAAVATSNARASGSPLPTSPVDIDGAGYDWWWAVLLGPVDHRPHMMYWVQCQNIVLYGLYIRNAPMFHILMEDSTDVYVKNLTIYVDTEKQAELSKRKEQLVGFVPEASPFNALDGLELLDIGLPSLNLPTFPLNTDGLDPSVERLLLEDFYIENYDDAVAVKPCSGVGIFCQCASDMTVRNGAVRFSVGLTIGSVPPHEENNCVSNITFIDVSMKTPFKALYIKTNPGQLGTGTIQDINYVNIDIQTPLWYPIWIGPQQQKQPANGTDTGCSFFYPLNQTCATQPLVTISGITLSNVTTTGGLTLPGVLLCDPTNPCTDITFDYVQNTGPFLVSKQYVCKNVQGSQYSTQPQLSCLDQQEEVGSQTKILLE